MLALEDLVAGLALLSMTAYALLGIADFGGGVWDLLAFGRRKEQQRRAISQAIGPVWEANHVWLIFFMIILFVAYPRAFAALSIAMFIPFHLVLAGIVLRGAAFVFRNYGPTRRWRRAWSRVFGSASVITPMLLGMAVAAVSSGGIRVVGGRVDVDPFAAWLSPFAFAAGLTTVAVGAYLAAVYLTLETSGIVQEDFRKRALWAAGSVSIITLAAAPIMAREAPRLWSKLGGGLPELILAIYVLIALTSILAIVRRRYRLARFATGIQVATLFWGWALAQRPYIIYPDISVSNAAASEATLRFLLWTVPIGGLLLAPSLWFLFSVFKTGEFKSCDPH